MKEQSNHLYELIQNQIKSVIQNLSEQQSNDRLVHDISDAMKNLSILNEQLQTELEKLKANSEWKRFAIAFYGETNAGKSTLIEALRLQLGEKTKLENQQKFKEIQKQFGLTQEAFDEVRHVIMDTEKALKSVEQELDEISKKFAELVMKAELSVSHLEEQTTKESVELTNQHTKVLNQLESDVIKLNDFLEKIINDRNWWQKIQALFSPPLEKKQLLEKISHIEKVKKQQKIENQNLLAKHDQLKQQAISNLASIQVLKQQEKTSTNRKQQELQETLLSAEVEMNRLDNEARRLTEFADGQIIGDGRSDFTRENTIFNFNLGEQQFSLIDVPGIEGEEAIVNSPIEDALRKAHAVFYVTRTPRPPQTNDGNNTSKKGTLEKIKAHLGAQSEVWSIYNHPANSPRQLTSPLLNSDNLESLIAMDEKLKAELKEQYCGSFVVSARPAYLALTECTVPGSRDATEQRKFIEKFSNIQTVLSLSGMTEFISFLQTTIIGDFKNKIRRSNLNKAYKALETSLNELEKEKTKFSSIERELKHEVSNAKSQINVGLEEFTGNLSAACSKIRRSFNDEIQTNIYNDIADDISNDDFNRNLKYLLNKNAEAIQEKLIQAIQCEANALGQKIENIIKRSAHHLKNIVEEQRNTFGKAKDFNVNINIDSGLKVSGLIASTIGAAVGVAFLLSNPAGWTIAFIGGVLALVGSIVGLLKSAWGFFDSDYKKSQQRKEADKVLREAVNNIENEMDNIVNQVKNEISIEMEKIKVLLDEPVEQCIEITALLHQANYELTAIARNVKS